MNGQIKAFFTALAFLTRLPVPASWQAHDRMDDTPPWFAPVGLILGALLALPLYLLQNRLDGLLGGCLAVAGLQLLCGGFHADGLADSADGFWSSRPKERMLQIMRDSHIGAMGTMALVLVLLTDAAALGRLGANELWKAALLGPVAGRLMCVAHGLLLPYVREEGLGQTLFNAEGNRMTIRWIAWFIQMAMLVAGAVWLMGLRGGWGCAAAAVTAAAWSWNCRLNIGGGTGDTAGATVELSTCAFWLGCAVG